MSGPREENPSQVVARYQARRDFPVLGFTITGVSSFWNELTELVDDAPLMEPAVHEALLEFGRAVERVKPNLDPARVESFRVKTFEKAGLQLVGNVAYERDEPAYYSLGSFLLETALEDGDESAEIMASALLTLEQALGYGSS